MDPTPLTARPLNVELRALHVFAEVVRHGGFSRAADAVHSTQSTVSKTVGRLEDEVGVPLLRRHSRGVELTAAGELVYRRAQAMLAQRELLTQDVQALTRRPRGTLRLGFSRLETSAFFARALAEYRRRHPEVELSVCVDADSQLVQRLLRGELDAAGMVCPQESRIETLVLQREPLMVLLPRDHALARREHLAIEDLAGEPLVLFEDKCPLNDKALRAFDCEGLTVRIALKTSQVGLILELVAEGLGVGFMPRTVVRNRPHPRVAAIPLRGSEHAWVFAAAWSRDSVQSQATRTWIALLRELYVSRSAALPEAA
jgi:DNA-binding transcriptional LysR family regulator